MLDPNRRQERPTYAAIQDALREGAFAHVDFTAPALEELLVELRATHANGGAEFAMFTIKADPTLDWFISRNRFIEIDLFEHLFRSVAFRAALPKLQGPAELKSLEWEWSSSYLFDGDLARTLMGGGAYERYKRGGSEAKRLGAAVCAELFGDRYEEVQFFKTFEPWSDWFFDVAWDTTWIAVDKRTNRIWTLCVTDTD
jgi:hypothetical protein